MNIYTYKHTRTHAHTRLDGSTKQSCMTGLDDNQDIVHNPDIVHNNLVLADQNIVRTTPGTGDPITTAENNRTWGSN